MQSGGSLKRLLNVHLGSFVTFLIFCQLLPGSPQQQHHAGDSQEEVDIFHRRGEGWFWIWWQIKRIKMERKKFKRYIPYLQHRGPQEVGTRQQAGGGNVYYHHSSYHNGWHNQVVCPLFRNKTIRNVHQEVRSQEEDPLLLMMQVINNLPNIIQ